jgi:DMSO/TMAO reductase YedYZ molybdopterin-dependent catalytic subunit
VAESSQRKLPPGQKPIGSILRWGIDHPGIVQENPVIRPENWTLTVDGEVETAIKLGWREFLQLPMVEVVRDFHCVEGWSVLDCRWKGVPFKALVERAKPREEAKYVWFECADGYTTSLELGDLMGDDILLVYQLNDEPLPPELGGPVRLIVPDKYAYKSPMWMARISFVRIKGLGYWEERGYSDTADVWKNDRRAKRGILGF